MRQSFIEAVSKHLCFEYGGVLIKLLDLLRWRVLRTTFLSLFFSRFFWNFIFFLVCFFWLLGLLQLFLGLLLRVLRHIDCLHWSYRSLDVWLWAFLAEIGFLSLFRRFHFFPQIFTLFTSSCLVSVSWSISLAYNSSLSSVKEVSLLSVFASERVLALIICSENVILFSSSLILSD